MENSTRYCWYFIAQIVMQILAGVQELMQSNHSLRSREVLTSLPQLQEHLDLPANVRNEVDSLINWVQTYEFVLMATI